MQCFALHGLHQAYSTKRENVNLYTHACNGNELCQGGICVSYTTNEVGSEYRIVHSTIQYSTIVHNVNQSYITLVQIVRLPGPYDLSTTCADPQSMLWLVFIQWAFRTSPVDTALLCLLILVFKGRPVSLM